jgi:hypothetical protein
MSLNTHPTKKGKFEKEILQLQYFDKQQQHGLLS